MYDAPSTSRFLYTESRTAMRRLAFSHLARLAALFKENVDRIDLLLRQRPLPCNTVLSAWNEIDLVLYSLVLRQLKWDFVWKDVSILVQEIVIGRSPERIP